IYPWRPFGIAVFLLVFVLPFIGLLGVKPKKSSLLLTTFALVSLLGIWLERYLEIVPSINGGAGPALGVPEIGVALLFGGLFLLSLGWFGARYPMLSLRLEIVPSINGGAGPALGVPEIGVALLFGGLFLLSLGWFGARYPMLSPRL